MSLFGSLMQDLERDPIFGAHTRAMNQMNRMMNSMIGGGGFGPMGMMGGGLMESPFAALTGPSGGHPHHDMMMPFGGGSMLSPFGHMGHMGGFPDFNDLMRHDGGGNGHSFSSMSVTSITSGPDGRPQVYQASNQTATAPGGVRETRKAVADSRSGTKKMSVGRHMGDRAHVREREENVYTGQREENEELINLGEDEAEIFDREWKNRAYGRGQYSHSMSMPAITEADYERPRSHGHRERHHHHHHHRQRISYPTPTSTLDAGSGVVIEELPPSDDEDQGRNTGTPASTTSMPSSSSAARRSPYTRDKKAQKTRRAKKY